MNAPSRLAVYGAGPLVVLREGDPAYLHVHPDGAPGDGVTEAGRGDDDPPGHSHDHQH